MSHFAYAIDAKRREYIGMGRTSGNLFNAYDQIIELSSVKDAGTREEFEEAIVRAFAEHEIPATPYAVKVIGQHVTPDYKVFVDSGDLPWNENLPGDELKCVLWTCLGSTFESDTKDIFGRRFGIQMTIPLRERLRGVGCWDLAGATLPQLLDRGCILSKYIER